MKLLPTKRYNSIWEIPVSVLKEMGITLVLADMDNTLAYWHTACVPDQAKLWVRQVKDAGITVALFTNSKGENADEIGKNLDIPVYKNAKKPFTGPLKTIMAKLEVKPENVLMVGDQLFTDIQLANSVGVKSVLTVPLSDMEWWATKVFNRTREKLVWRFLFK